MSSVREVIACDFNVIGSTVEVKQVGRITNSLTIVYNLKDEGSED